MKKTALGMLLLMLSTACVGCTTTQQAMKRANEEFVGKNMDDFVLRYGVPQTKYQLNNGDSVYVWRSDVRNYNLPETTHISGQVSPSGYYSGTATTTGGGTLTVFCELQIHTNTDGIILDIRALRDTIGRWTTSRASEIFR
jgi:hypothetical protein